MSTISAIITAISNDLTAKEKMYGIEIEHIKGIINFKYKGVLKLREKIMGK